VTTKEIKDVLFLFFFNLGNKELKNKEVSGNRVKIAKKNLQLEKKDGWAHKIFLLTNGNTRVVPWRKMGSTSLDEKDRKLDCRVVLMWSWMVHHVINYVLEFKLCKTRKNAPKNHKEVIRV
jgi:hypothetical protein